MTRTDDEFVSGLDMSAAPPILGYNEVVARSDAAVHVEVTETGDPAVVTRPYGRGAVLAYMSDPAPHWGCNFVQWDDYDRFWTGAVEHLLEMRHSIGRTS
jgi:uncharacterized membrane protein